MNYKVTVVKRGLVVCVAAAGCGVDVGVGDVNDTACVVIAMVMVPTKFPPPARPYNWTSP